MAGPPRTATGPRAQRFCRTKNVGTFKASLVGDGAGIRRRRLSFPRSAQGPGLWLEVARGAGQGPPGERKFSGRLMNLDSCLSVTPHFGCEVLTKTGRPTSWLRTSGNANGLRPKIPRSGPQFFLKFLKETQNPSV